MTILCALYDEKESEIWLGSNDRATIWRYTCARAYVQMADIWRLGDWSFRR